MDWLREFAQVGGDLPSLAGKPVDVIGFVYRDKRTTGGAFWVARYTLSCCVADATGIGMIVQSAKSDTYAEGSWVRVRGTIALSKSDGESLPMIAASLIDAVEQPDNPYLFP